MKNKVKLWVVIILTIILTAITLDILEEDNVTLVSETGCCSITVNGTMYDDVTIITWTDNTTLNTTFTDTVPSNDYDIQWSINEMEELCFTYHGH